MHECNTFYNGIYYYKYACEHLQYFIAAQLYFLVMLFFLELKPIPYVCMTVSQ